VVCVGQNPGYFEDVEGLPFIGKSGDLLHNGFLKPARIHELATIYITNAVRCATPANAKPPAKSLSTCFPLYTEPDLSAISLTCSCLYVLCLGAPASEAVFKQLFKMKVSQKDAFSYNGREFTWERPVVVCTEVDHQESTVSFEHATSPTPVTIFSTFHPAFVMRVPNASHDVSLHMSALSRHLRGEAPVVTSPTVIETFAPPSTCRWRCPNCQGKPHCQNPDCTAPLR
jgi:uracil-DNA glycosylase family 4